jgi:cell division septation protein DedD
MSSTQGLRSQGVACLSFSAALAVLTWLSSPAIADRIVIVPEAPVVQPEPAPAPYGYVVQISSQRSEAEALASFRSMQSKYPRELGDREPIVRPLDLGPPKGVYFRVMVGPFGSAGEAEQLCNDLKADGGKCIVLKN